MTNRERAEALLHKLEMSNAPYAQRLDAVERAIEAAVAEEREECARIVDDWQVTNRAYELAQKWAETLSAVGPMRADIQEAIDAAVAEEREACAKVAMKLGHAVESDAMATGAYATATAIRALGASNED